MHMLERRRDTHASASLATASSLLTAVGLQVLTFDELGVSGHPNHIMTHYGVLQWHLHDGASCEVLCLVCDLFVPSLCNA